DLSDFTLRSKISFAVRQISLRVLTRRGWVVGVAVLWGHFISDDVEKLQYIHHRNIMATNSC
ncbi:MAG TPA: hypothetical protein DHU79_00910, partial [Clostridiales bacterium]|nr:hypothetical protein [Clostridiales bacterium]